MRLRRLRRLTIVLPLLAVGCVEAQPARTSFPPLEYDYLNPVGLNVATVDTEARATPNVTVPTAIDPVATLLRMGRDRLKAYGTSARAVFAVTEVALNQRAGGIEGTFGVELDIYTSANTRAAYAEARVYRRVEGQGDDLRGAVYDLEKQLMDAMNVELEFQVRRSLKAWVAAAPSAAGTAPVEQQALPPPGAGAVAVPYTPPPAPSSLGGPTAPMLNLAPPAPQSQPEPAAAAPAPSAPGYSAPAYPAPTYPAPASPPAYAPPAYTPPAYTPPDYSPQGYVPPGYVQPPPSY